MTIGYFNVGAGSVNLEEVAAAVNRANLLVGRPSRAAARRRDSRGPEIITRRGAVQELRRRADRDALRELRQDGWTPPDGLVAEMRRDGLRLDAGLGPGAPGYPRDFEFRRQRILQEARRPLSSEMLFRRDPEAPPLGALTYTSRRRIASGTSAVHRQGEAFPVVDVEDLEEEWQVAYLVTSIGASFFQTLSENYAGLRKYDDKARAALRVLREHMNRVAFAGIKAKKLYGALNYPSLLRREMAVAFDGTDNAEDVVADLNLLCDTPIIRSGTAMKPNRLAVSPAIHRYLHETQFATGTGMSIADWFVKGQSSATNIRTIEMAQELAAGTDEMVAAGAPSNRDGLLAYSDEPDSTKQVVIQDPTFLPLHRINALDTQEVGFCAIGGMNMYDVGNNLLGFAAARQY